MINLKMKNLKMKKEDLTNMKTFIFENEKQNIDKKNKINRHRYY
jgi:hypothetical protein